MNNNMTNISRGREEFPGKAMAPDPDEEEYEVDQGQAEQTGLVTQIVQTSEDEPIEDMPLADEEAAAESEMAEDADCSSDALPPKTEPKSGKKTLLLPDLVPMWKYMMSSAYGNRRLALYTFLNQQLRRGWLSQIVGFRVLNTVINKEACEFNGVTFWKIDRENFYADVDVTLTLKTPDGIREWNGILVCWCGFDDKFDLSVEELTKSVKRTEEDGYTMLSPFLIPYMTNKQMDEFAERLWIRYA